jgi:hypothetical protein
MVTRRQKAWAFAVGFKHGATPSQMRQWKSVYPQWSYAAGYSSGRNVRQTAATVFAVTKLIGKALKGGLS